MFKKITGLILCAFLLFSLASCTNKENNTQNSTVTTTSKKQTGDSKTLEFFKTHFDSQEYTMTLKTTDEETGSDSVVTIGIKGDIYYTDDNSAGNHSTVFYKDGQTTTISHDNKTYYINTTDDEMSQSNEKFSSSDFAGKEFSTGTETIDGKKYYCEEFNDEYGTARYCFDGDDLKYMVNVNSETGKNTYIEITDIKPSFDESLLTIPEGYEALDY